MAMDATQAAGRIVPAKTKPRSGPATPMRSTGPLGSALILFALGALTIFLVYPVLLVFWGAFRPGGVLTGSAGSSLTLANFSRIFESGFALFIFNSLVICLGAVLISTVLAIGAAYAITRLALPFRSLFYGCLMAGQFFPWIVLITPLFILFARLGFTNSYLAMIFCYTAVALPFSVYMLTGYLATVPKSLDEAAIIDGASRLQVITRVIVPMLWPGIVATATYAFLQCWAEYLLALAFLTQTEMKTIPLGLYQFFGDDQIDWGAVMAASAVATLPPLLLFLPLQNRLTSGLTAGAVK